MTEDLLSLGFINKHYLGYDSLRGCKNFLRAKGLQIIRLGKQYFVKTEDFNEVINTISNRSNSNKKKKSNKHLPIEYEDIYRDLLSRVNYI